MSEQTSCYAAAHMPERAPLDLQTQDFGHSPKPRARHAASLTDWLWRLSAFGPSVALTLSFVVGLADWFGAGGVTALEASVIGLVALTLIWVSITVSSVILALVRRLISRPRRLPERPARSDTGLSVALLVPVYNETPSDVFGNAQAMLKDLAARRSASTFSLFILSDTKDAVIGAAEERAFFALQAIAPHDVDVHYRRRAKNTDKKVGNLNDWIENWGAAYDAMLVLDADSLMTGFAIRNLAHALARDPDAGLLQSYPSLIGSETLFGRIQQFSSQVYGWLQAEGLAVWCLREGNYWGHNAIIRTRASAQSAKLPYLPGRNGAQHLIFSHDFVEAGLLRRAGWTVRFLPNVGGSYEETPQTLIDYALRDRRWCRGNMQHLRLLTASGFHPLSRFHLLQGAVSFLLSPAWLALIIIWSAVGFFEQRQGVEYFSSANPLTPVWPYESPISGWVYLAVIYGMLLTPKLAATVALSLRRQTRRSYGSVLRFYATALFEIFCSVIYAPILMMQQTIAVMIAATGRSGSWAPQARGATGYTWAQTIRFHAAEQVCGVLLTAAIFLGYASAWLTLIAFSLMLAAPLSKLSAVRVAGAWLSPLRLDAPNTLREPRIFVSARAERARMRMLLEQSEPALVAAE
ncbi:MAG: glucans biosynthesis glucosyltransferase MdoH [Pseudomonadota bacterium]